jgi:hypothetical protein
MKKPKPEPVSDLLARFLALPPKDVPDAARQVPGWKHMPYKPAEALCLGMACLTDNVTQTSTLLAQHPHLLNTPCTPFVVFDHEFNKSGNMGFSDMSPLASALSTRAWKVVDFLLDCPGIEVNKAECQPTGGPMGEPEWTPLLQVVKSLDAVSVKGMPKPLSVIGALLEKGADPLKRTLHGSPFAHALGHAMEPSGNGGDRNGASTLGMFQGKMALLEALTRDPALFSPEQWAKPERADAVSALRRFYQAEKMFPAPFSGGALWLEKRDWLKAWTNLPFDDLQSLVVGDLLGRGIHLPFLEDLFPEVFATMAAINLDGQLPSSSTARPTLRL